MTCLAVSVGVGRIVPGVAHVESWPYQAIGVGYGVLGIAFMVIAQRRVRAVERAVDRGNFARLDDRVSFALLGAGIVLGAGTILLILFES